MIPTLMKLDVAFNYLLLKLKKKKKKNQVNLDVRYKMDQGLTWEVTMGC